jgi:hypothetical protein
LENYNWNKKRLAAGLEKPGIISENSPADFKNSRIPTQENLQWVWEILKIQLMKLLSWLEKFRNQALENFRIQLGKFQYSAGKLSESSWENFRIQLGKFPCRSR